MVLKVQDQLYTKTQKQVKTVKVENELVDILAYERAIKYARNKGSIVVSSSGNEGLDVNDTKKVEEYLLVYQILKM